MDPDHSINVAMEKIAVSKFKATCLAVIERVNRTGESICVTKFGKPMAEISPVRNEPSASWLGSGIGTAEILGDIVEATGDLDPDAVVREWDDLTRTPKLKPRKRSPARKSNDAAQ